MKKICDYVYKIILHVYIFILHVYIVILHAFMIKYKEEIQTPMSIFVLPFEKYVIRYSC